MKSPSSTKLCEHSDLLYRESQKGVKKERGQKERKEREKKGSRKEKRKGQVFSGCCPNPFFSKNQGDLGGTKSQ